MSWGVEWTVSPIERYMFYAGISKHMVQCSAVLGEWFSSTAWGTPNAHPKTCLLSLSELLAFYSVHLFSSFPPQRLGWCASFSYTSSLINIFISLFCHASSQRTVSKIMGLFQDSLLLQNYYGLQLGLILYTVLTLR